MAEVVEHRNINRPSPIAWVALFLAILALIIAWSAYNRSGKDLEDSAADAIESTTQESGEAAQDASDTVEQGVDTGPDGVDDGAQ